MSENFKHIQAAHCENGVTTSLLRFHGLEFMNEPLAFGMGSGLFYIHIPFIEVNGGPAVSFRNLPGNIFKKTCKSLGIQVKRQKFSNQLDAQKSLDAQISQGIPVGCQVGVYHLPYFPIEYRFHFNAHNIIVFGKENNRYLISDPVMETTTQLSSDELEKVRFAKGLFAPKGHLYYPINVGIITDEIIRKAIVKGIKRNIRDMLHIPGNVVGVSGIKYTAGKIRKFREKKGIRKAGLALAQIVRMQEEIGTGGGGFRYIYAAFLEKANAYFQEDKLLNISDLFTQAGDMWRNNAVKMAGVYKGRLTEQKDFDEIADAMIEIAEKEKEAFKKLSKLNF